MRENFQKVLQFRIIPVFTIYDDQYADPVAAGLHCAEIIFRTNAAEKVVRLPQVIVTAHIGAHPDEAAITMGRMSLRACPEVLRSKQPSYVVNPEVYERKRD